MKYELIKEYPGSPKQGTIVKYGTYKDVAAGQLKDIECFLEVDNENEIVPYWHVINHPSYWAKIDESVLVVEDIKHLVRIEAFRWGDHGGQHVNKVDSAVRLTCDELYFRADCGYHRSRNQNIDVCLDSLQAFLDKLPESVIEHYKK